MSDQCLTVVYVEDDVDIRELVTMTFERESSIRLLAIGPEHQVLGYLRDTRPDLVLLDVMMPGIDGRTIAAAMKADPLLSAVPFVFMTAKARAHDITDLYQLGALAIILKPFNLVELPKEVRNLLARRQEE